MSAISLALAAALACSGSAARADQTSNQANTPKESAKSAAVAATTETGSTASGTTATKPTAAKPKHPPFAELLGDAEGIAGLIKLYRKDTKLYGELTATELNRDFIVVISIARGIGRRPLLGGMSWGFGDDWIWQFRKADDRIQIVRRNVRFRAAKGSPEEQAVRRAYTDSVLFSLPIATVGSGGSYVVDLTPVFMSDLPQISSALRGYTFAADKSTWASVKGFRDNIEIQVAATYASNGTEQLDTVADSRGATINVHYSLSRLPDTGYEPRLADDRVGYFLSVLKDYSKSTDPDRFVRYINRWDLRKADPTAELSPPKTPIIFWLEKSIPYQYRAPIREGILEWNKAFEKAGLLNAIEVRQQPADADWDPEDINYNTFRWMTASAGFAMGPSRVNPLTGQILDADIILDADFVQSWRERMDAEGPPAATVAGLVDPREWLAVIDPAAAATQHRHNGCECAAGFARQLAFASVALAPAQKPISKPEMDRLILQGIKSVAIHEVGHTLGLRHNFKASSWLSLDDLGDAAKTHNLGLAASVMDYLPLNVAPKGQKQGAYFNLVLGPYDLWAIEYGYKPLSGGTEGEWPQLQKIAARSGDPALQYATDEDTRPGDPDPLVNRFDLGKEPLQYARRQMQLVEQSWANVVERTTADGDGYQRARRAFNLLLGEYGRAAQFAARYVGGIYVHRHHRGDANARPPLVLVETAKQREAMDLLSQSIFAVDAFRLPAQVYGSLSPSFWSHWGSEPLTRSDYPARELILGNQDRVLQQLLSPVTLARLLDAELQRPADQSAFTAAELLHRLSGAIFAELDKLPAGEFSDGKPAIGGLRRDLQRRYVERLAEIALGKTAAPDECESLASAELQGTEARIKQVLAGKAKLDLSTRAHLQETADRVRKVLDARIDRKGP